MVWGALLIALGPPIPSAFGCGYGAGVAALLGAALGLGAARGTPPANRPTCHLVAGWRGCGASIRPVCVGPGSPGRSAPPSPWLRSTGSAAGPFGCRSLRFREARWVLGLGRQGVDYKGVGYPVRLPRGGLRAWRGLPHFPGLRGRTRVGAGACRIPWVRRVLGHPGRRFRLGSGLALARVRRLGGSDHEAPVIPRPTAGIACRSVLVLQPRW